MGLSERMSLMASQIQDGAKSTTKSLFNIFLRALTGLVLGFTLALVAQQMIGFGSFGLFFMTTVVLGLFYKLSSAWSIASILIFDLICVLVALSLRMYILIAP